MVMAFWNAPLLDPNHAEHAIDAALTMLAKVEELNQFCGQRITRD